MHSYKKIFFVFFSILFAGIYCSFILTQGEFNFKKDYELSTLFLNMWDHLSNFDVFIDDEIIGGEGWIINGKTTAYFLPFPALIRGALSIFGFGKSSTLSILIAALLFITSSICIWLNFYNQMYLESKKINLISSNIIIIFISFCSPIIALIGYPAPFWEVILWAAALFLAACFFSIHILTASISKSKTSYLLFVIFCGLTLFTRATFALSACVLFAITISIIFFKQWNPYKTFISNLRLNKFLIFCCILFSLFLMILLAYNYAKWGSPFEFYPMQYYKMMSDEKKNIFFSHGYGAMNIIRFPESLSYYFIPSTDNFELKPPFIKFGETYYFSGLANFDYREFALPLTISIPAYVLLFISGVYIFFKLILLKQFKGVICFIPTAISALIPILIILSMHALAIRYGGDLIPAILLFSLFSLSYLLKKYNFSSLDPIKKNKSFAYRFKYPIFFLLIGIFLIISCYFSTVATLQEYITWKNAYQSTFYVKNKIGQVITFEAYGHNSPVGNSLKSGWAKDLEPWGTWSNASVATLVLLPPIALSKSNYILVNYRAFVVPGHPAQKMEIWVNGVFNQAVELTKPDGILRIDNLTDQNTPFNV